MEKLDQKSINFFNENYQNIEVQFDMHHGFENLKRAINLLDQKDKKNS